MVGCNLHLACIGVALFIYSAQMQGDKWTTYLTLCLLNSIHALLVSNAVSTGMKRLAC